MSVFVKTAAVAAVSVIGVVGQGKQPGGNYNPTMLLGTNCTKGANCSDLSTALTLDANYRGVKDDKLWPVNVDTLDKVYGITSADEGKGVNILFNPVKDSSGNVKNGGARTYLTTNSDDDADYHLFHLLNREFSFTVDLNNMDCGMNGALYFVSMDGDPSIHTGNTAGAAFGTGYCDAQCGQYNINYINGESVADNKFGLGQHSKGPCCAELDIWEANNWAAAMTTHTGPTSLLECTRTSASDQTCLDKNCDSFGCDMNTYRLGNHGFFGKGGCVDTEKEVTVVTQFITDTGKDDGNLHEIKQFYIQGTEIIDIPSKLSTDFSSLTDEYCVAEETLFPGNHWSSKTGQVSDMTGALKKGMVLVVSSWNDPASHMGWLDGNSGSSAGFQRGPCVTGGIPSDPKSYTTFDNSTDHTDHKVTYSNLKFGAINSTFDGANLTTSTCTSNPINPPTPSAPGPSPSGAPSEYPQPCPNTARWCSQRGCKTGSTWAAAHDYSGSNFCCTTDSESPVCSKEYPGQYYDNKEHTFYPPSCQLNVPSTCTSGAEYPEICPSGAEWCAADGAGTRPRVGSNCWGATKDNQSTGNGNYCCTGAGTSTTAPSGCSTNPYTYPDKSLTQRSARSPPTSKLSKFR